MQRASKYSSYLYAMIKVVTIVTLGILVMMVRYVMKTPQPLKSVLAGEEHFYKWTRGHIYYQIFGAKDAPPMVLFHAPEIGASSYEMRNIVEGLARQYCVYVLDLPGFGLSDHPQGTYSALTYRSLFEDFLRDVVDQPAILVASGLSGNYCLSIAQQHPEFCSGMILLTPALLYQKGSRPDWMMKLLDLTPLGFAIYTCLSMRWPLRLMLAWQHGVSYQQVTLAEVAYASAVAHQLGAHRAGISYLSGQLVLDNGLPIEQRDVLIHLPTLLIYGSESISISIQRGDHHHSERLISDHQQEVIVKHAGLRVHDEQPMAVVQAILVWGQDRQEEVVKPEEPVIANVEELVSESTIEAYCVKCRIKREMQAARRITTRNGRSAMEGTCPVCGTRLFRFVAGGKE